MSVGRRAPHAQRFGRLDLVPGRRPSRQPNPLTVACGLISQCLRLPKRMAKHDPHIFGPHAHRCFLDALQLERGQEEIEAVIRKVCRPPAPGQPARVSTLWTDRCFPWPEQRRVFLKWFHENYPS